LPARRTGIEQWRTSHWWHPVISCGRGTLASPSSATIAILRKSAEHWTILVKPQDTKNAKRSANEEGRNQNEEISSFSFFTSYFRLRSGVFPGSFDDRTGNLPDIACRFSFFVSIRRPAFANGIRDLRQCSHISHRIGARDARSIAQQIVHTANSSALRHSGIAALHGGNG